MTKVIPFVKYHGLGNDWLVVLGSDLPAGLTPFARKILDRRTGVGADGLIVVLKSAMRGHDARIRFINADGSEAEMSGNGIRCAGAFLLERKPQKRALEIETLAGVKTLEKGKSSGGKWMFRVRMGLPILTAAEIPFTPAETSSRLLRVPLKTYRGDLVVTVTSMGNPHCSVFVADFESVDWLRLGQEIEQNEHFPNRTNVEFVRLVSKNEVEVRFWERGVGHTMSSGTGSCAATVAAILNGLTDRHVRVRTEAGTLDVAWPRADEVLLTGPAERVMKGSYDYPVTR
ncbi:MAG: diaminopimelate epimerase [Terriglobia bacterium]|jgi:diaminopimelate epimerase